MTALTENSILADLTGAGPEATYREHLRQGRFMIQRGVTSAGHVFYPRTRAPGTGEGLEWVEASGGGTVYSTTVVRQRPEAGGDYNVAIIELTEGPRTMSQVIGIPPQEVAIGMKVRARIDERDGQPLLVFVPAKGEGA